MENEPPKNDQGTGCECGGTLLPLVLDEYDFTDYVGFKVTLRGFKGYRCDGCGGETLYGEIINGVMSFLALRLATKARLSGPEKRFLRSCFGAKILPSYTR